MPPMMVPAGVGPAVVETHVSTLFMVGEYVYKLKKSVRFDFVDLSSVAARERICRREVELNRRLAPDVYLGVATVLGPDGAPCGSLVVMRRMPDQRRLATLVREGAEVADCLRDVARALAAFHASADRSDEIDAAGSLPAVRALWESNLSTMAPFVGDVLDREMAARVALLADRFLRGRAELFAARVADGKVRDGHGDLLADDIFCLEDGPRILDCLEFDDALRYGDVLADVAFLAMDLERIGAVELAQQFLGWYREYAGETYPATLAHHYIAYRAHVRCKVACLRAAQGDASAVGEARRLLELCDRHLQAGRVVLVIVGGLPGTGKSTLAAGIADRRSWTVLRSDEVRKDLAGIAHTARRNEEFGEGLYDQRSTEATYQALLDRARILVEHGEPVVLDASWSSARWRDAARRLAAETASELLELRCDAPSEIAARRLVQRLAAESDPSDATAEVARRMAAVADPWATAVSIDTSSSRDRALTVALEHV